MRTAALVLLLLVPAAAHAQPADAYDQAVAARVAGRHAEAVRLLEPLSRERPQNADVWLLLGLAYTAEGRLDEAEAALATARRLSPDYQDVIDAQARLARMRQGAPPSWRADVAAGYSELTNGLDPWRFVSAYVTRQTGRTWLTGGVEHTHRFGHGDIYIEGRAARDFGAWSGYLAAGGAPDADHRAEAAVRGGAIAGPSRDGGWSLRPGVDASWARYSVGDVRSMQPALTVENGALSVRARWIATWDETDEFRSGYGLNGHWQANDRWRIMAGWADAPESSEGVTVDVQAVSLGVSVDLDDATAVRLDVVHEERDAYDRDGISAGLTRRF